MEPPTYTINTWGCLCLSFVSSDQKETSIWKRKVMDGNNHDHKNEASNVLRSQMKNKGSFVRYVLYSVSFSFQLQISCNFQLINLFIYCLWPRTTDTQWRHKSKISEKLGRCGRQNILRPLASRIDWWEGHWYYRYLIVVKGQ